MKPAAIRKQIEYLRDEQVPTDFLDVIELLLPIVEELAAPDPRDGQLIAWPSLVKRAREALK